MIEIRQEEYRGRPGSDIQRYVPLVLKEVFNER